MLLTAETASSSHLAMVQYITAQDRRTKAHDPKNPSEDFTQDYKVF
jgi:hypothetical protein